MSGFIYVSTSNIFMTKNDMTEDILHICLLTSQHKLKTYIILTLTGNINLLTSNESVDEISIHNYLI